MPISPAQLELDRIVRRLVEDIPNATASRVHELLTSEFADAEQALEALAGGVPYLLVIGPDSELALASVDAGGATIVRWGKLKGVEIETRYATPIARTEICWVLRHHKFPRENELTIEGASIPAENRDAVAASLRSLL